MNTVKFSEKDFKTLRNFQNKMNTVFGDTAYVGTDYATVVLEFSPVIKNMVRPFPLSEKYDYEVKFLSCEGCKKTALYLTLPEDTTFLCSSCLGKKKK